MVNQDNPACNDMEFCVIHRELCIKTPPPNSVGSSTMIWFSQHFQPLGCPGLTISPVYIRKLNLHSKLEIIHSGPEK